MDDIYYLDQPQDLAGGRIDDLSVGTGKRPITPADNVCPRTTCQQDLQIGNTQGDVMSCEGPPGVKALRKSCSNQAGSNNRPPAEYADSHGRLGATGDQ